jgi:hypothetical protein
MLEMTLPTMRGIIRHASLGTGRTTMLQRRHASGDSRRRITDDAMHTPNPMMLF